VSRSLHGKGKQRRRGVHRNQHSPDTRRWNAEHLIPERPVWMPVDTYTALARLRTELDGGRT
jgi:hypothetical protein